MHQFPPYSPFFGITLNQQGSTSYDAAGISETETKPGRTGSISESNRNDFKSYQLAENLVTDECNRLKETKSFMKQNVLDLEPSTKTSATQNESNTLNVSSQVSDQIIKDLVKEDEVCRNSNQQLPQSLVETVSAMVDLSTLTESGVWNNQLSSYAPSVNILNWYNLPSYGQTYNCSNMAPTYSPGCSIKGVTHSPEFGTMAPHIPSVRNTPVNCAPLPSTVFNVEQKSPCYGSFNLDTPKHYTWNAETIGKGFCMATDESTPQKDSQLSSSSMRQLLNETNYARKN